MSDGPGSRSEVIVDQNFAVQMSRGFSHGRDWIAVWFPPPLVEGFIFWFQSNWPREVGHHWEFGCLFRLSGFCEQVDIKFVRFVPDGPVPDLRWLLINVYVV